MMRNALRAGFTLIELLVTLILLGLLTAVVFPVVVQQIDDAEPTKAANDFANIRTGVEIFHLNVRPVYPGDLEDLVHQITTNEDGDLELAGFGAGAVGRWNGPYIDAAILEDQIVGDDDKETGNAVLTGFDLDIQNDIVCYDIANNTDTGATCVDGVHFLALKVLGATVTTTSSANFDSMDDLIDNGDGFTAGKLRALETDGTTAINATDDGTEVIYYLLMPYKG